MMLSFLSTFAGGLADSGAADARFWAYAGFFALVLFFLALDLGVFHREAHVVSMREAIAWSCVWAACGMAFAVFVYFAYDAKWLGLGVDTARYNSDEGLAAGGPLIVTGVVAGAEAVRQYLVGYVVEKSLALDNIFVIALIFGSFAVPARYQHRVLFWGVLGALVMRGAMILLGAELIMRQQWILMLFGALLVATAVKMAIVREHADAGRNPLVRLCKRFVPAVDFYDGERFFTKRTEPPVHVRGADGREVMAPPRPGTLSAKWAVTPLFLALLCVELADLVFAVDSVPAIFAITPDPFLVLTSNVFAILGLRSLYFCLAAMIARFHLLKPALVLILAFVGVKLLLLSVPPHLDWIGLTERTPVKIDTMVSLLVVAGTLVAAIVVSWLTRRPATGTAPTGGGG
jgi:tellurite resistance protein TerC